MTHQSALFRFRGLFDAALQEYERTTNITLSKHPLSEKLDNCHSLESITTFLQVQPGEFGSFQGRDKVMKSIKNIASILYTLSTTATLGGDATSFVSYIPGRSWWYPSSDTYSTVIPTCESNTNRPRHPPCCMCPFLRCYLRLLTSKCTRPPMG